MTRAIVSGLTLLAALSLSATARAQQLVLGGDLGVASGLELGDPGDGSTLARRARTRLTLGVDGRVDEDLAQGLGAVAWAEIEPHVAVGGELRYVRWITPHVTAFAGGTGEIAPHTLLGGVLGVQALFFLDAKRTRLVVEPSFSALPLGTDLPGDKPLLWALLSVKLHANL